MIKKIVVCDKCHEAEAKYYTGRRMDVVYCEKCIREVMGAQRVDCLKCAQCGRELQNPIHLVKDGRHYCSVKCLMKVCFGDTAGDELNDTHKEYLIANG